MRWTLASLLMLILFWLPAVNGVICGALAGWPEHDRHKTVSSALWASLALFPILWIMSQYTLAWRPFQDWNGELKAAISVLPMIATAVLVTALRTAHRAV